MQHVADMCPPDLRQPGWSGGKQILSPAFPLQGEAGDSVRAQDKGQHIQQGGFAASAGPDNSQRLTVEDFKAGDDQGEAGAVFLAADA